MPGKGAGIIVASSFSSSNWLSNEPVVAVAATVAVGLVDLLFACPLLMQTLELGVEYSSLLSECKLSELVLLLTLNRLVVFVIAVDTLKSEPP